MWFPTVVLIFGVSTKGDLQWATWLGGTWSHFQGVVSAVVYCSKGDIKESVVSLLGCSRLNLVLPANTCTPHAHSLESRPTPHATTRERA